MTLSIHHLITHLYLYMTMSIMTRSPTYTWPCLQWPHHPLIHDPVYNEYITHLQMILSSHDVVTLLGLYKTVYHYHITHLYINRSTMTLWSKYKYLLLPWPHHPLIQDSVILTSLYIVCHSNWNKKKVTLKSTFHDFKYIQCNPTSMFIYFLNLFNNGHVLDLRTHIVAVHREMKLPLA